MEQYVFNRVNPAVGMIYSPSRFAVFTLAIAKPAVRLRRSELSCADPNEPCSLPNALVSDPPLKQVVTRTLEAWREAADRKASCAGAQTGFAAKNYNDLLFVASEQTGFGYFTNFGRTRGVRRRKRVSAAEFNISLSAATTHFLTQPTRARRQWMGAAIVSTTVGTGLDGNITVQPGDPNSTDSAKHDESLRRLRAHVKDPGGPRLHRGGTIVRARQANITWISPMVCIISGLDSPLAMES